MSDFVVSARKYRPSTFKSVVGQEALTTTLKNAIQQDKLSHAYLFCGPRGVGKTSCARIFAKTINCQNRTPEGEACNACESCMAINEQRSYNVLELDAASNNSVNDIRSLIEQVYISPTLGKYRVYIIDEVHMLSTAAFNAFLKTLEEPPAHAIFILATTEKHKVLPTIISRCQVHDFNRITSEDIAKHLQYIAQEEHIEAESEALYLIAMSADGGMRDALSMFDQIAGFGNGRITMEGVRANLNLLDEDEYFSLLGYILNGNHAKVLGIIDRLLAKGYEGDIIMHGFSNFLRNVLLAQTPDTFELIEAPSMVKERMKKAGAYTPSYLLWEFLKTSSSVGAKYKSSNERRLALEMALLSMCERSKKSALRTPSEPENPTPSDGTTSETPTSSATQQAPPTAKAPQQIAQPQPRRVTISTVRETSKLNAQQKTASRTPNNAQVQYGYSISQGKRTGIKESPKERESAPSTREKRSNPVTQKQLEIAWSEFISKLDRIIMKEALRGSHPKLADDGHTIQLRFKNTTQEQLVDEASPDLLRHLCDRLENDHLVLEYHVEKDPSIIGPITPREKFDYFAKHNKWFKQMAEELKLRPIL
ncbi:MAG: DNA polymerase III subunit gamma/tau [Porphyromonas sp.]|nr:DNA polymerase III subunit gamma/tau [Porphyromonas sp.]